MSLDGVSVTYGHVPVLDRVTLLVEPGERVAVVGPERDGQVGGTPAVAGFSARIVRAAIASAS